MKKMAFIGTGVMGGALARAACKGCDPKDIVVTDYDSEKGKGICRGDQAQNMLPQMPKRSKAASFILIGVKPQVGEAVLSEIGPVVKECIGNGEEKIIVSIMVSVSTDTIVQWLGVDVNIPVQ